MPLKHEVEEITLKNGAKGLFIYTPHTTSLHYAVHFRAGNDFVKDPAKSQAAHIMEHMSFGANAKFPSGEAFSQEFSKNGAYSNAWTSNIDMLYYIDAALMEWDRIFDLQTLAITEPKYLPKVLKAEKGNVYEELTGYANDHVRVLWQRIMRKAGLVRWYDPEEIKTIDAVTLSDIKEHHKYTHTTNNMRFFMVGDLKPHREELITKLEKWKLPKGKRLPLMVDTVKDVGLVHVKRKDLPNLTFNITFFINRTLNRRELRAMNVLNHILTGTFHSRIWGKARARGICYGMNNWIDSSVTGSTEWAFVGQVSLKNARELYELIASQLKKLKKENVTQEELDAAKEYRLGSLQMNVETVSSLANWYADQYYEYDRIDSVEAFPKLIRGTTLEEIKDLANEFFTSGLHAFGAIGNIEKEDLKAHQDAFAKIFEDR